jgi:hypothetical protein
MLTTAPGRLRTPSCWSAVHRNGPSDTWQIELLDEMPAAERPEPFTSQRHFFKSRPAALEWLSIREADAEHAG